MSAAEDTLLIQIVAAGLPVPECQVRFHPVRRFRWDFCWNPAPNGKRIAIEVMGSVYAQGHHTQGKGYEDDCTKANLGALMGYTVLRYTPGMIERGEAIRDIERALR